MGGGAASVVQNTGATMVDAQMTNVRILKPFPNFEAVYQGQPAGFPISFPGERDPRAAANQPGFDPNLIAGIPVPQGARVLLNIPITPGIPTGSQVYSYRIVERFTNLNDYRDPPRNQGRPPFHFPRSSPGAPDTTGGASSPRTLRPAAWRDVGFEQAEVLTENGKLVLRPEEIVVGRGGIINIFQPLLPDGSSGVLQQGVLDPVTNPTAAPVPIFLPFWFDAEGDEIIILATREDVVQPNVNWDFTANDADLAFSNIYGTGAGAHANFPDLGIYMQTGTTP
jgi:hypothetical protein